MIDLVARGSRILAVAGSVVCVVVTIALVRPEDRFVGALFVAAAVWSAATACCALIATRSRRIPAPLGGGSVTSILRVGAEPADVVRTSVVLAMQAGPVIVVATDRRRVLEKLGSLEVSVVTARSIEEAVNEAASLVTTDAVLVHSASSFPVAPACAAAAAQLRDGVGWVVGSSQPFNDDGYAPERRELVGARLRARARGAGLDLWERDAVLVRTAMLRDAPLRPGRPWGAWLRARRRDGGGERWHGVDHRAPLTRRASPAGAEAYWPATVSRQRAAAADLGDAVAVGHGRARFAAIGLLLRELYAYPAAVWMLAPLLFAFSGYPFRGAPIVFIALHVTAGSLRWLSSCASTAVVPRPVQDVLAAVYGLPGSFVALPSAVSRRVRPQRFHLPGRPLVWPAIVLTLVSAVPLIGPGSGRGIPSTATVVVALVNLVLLWAFALQALLQRRWERSSYRFRVQLPALVAGRHAMTHDASPSGMAVTGRFDEEVAVGAVLPISVTLSDGSSIDATAVVADSGRHGDADVLGLSVQFSEQDQARWIRQLFTATVPEVAADPVAAAPIGAARLTPVIDRVAVSVVGVFSALAVVILVLVLMGYRPLVVRSGSMTPALQVGDLVIVEDIPARRMDVGDIVTFDDPEGRGDTITHRVLGITVDGGVLHVETKGDANELSESWSTETEQIVGRNTVRVPEVGGFVEFVHERMRWILGVVGAAYAAMALLRTPRPRWHAITPAARPG